MGRTEKGQRKPTTVWLEAEIGAGGNDKRKFFYCYNCRIPVLKYTGDVMTIVPGGHPYTPGTIQRCKGNIKLDDGTWEECGMEYSFIGSVYTMNPSMT